MITCPPKILKVSWILLLYTLNFCTIVTSYSCQSPDDNGILIPQYGNISSSSEEISSDFAFLNIRLKKIWPNGIVKYKLSPSLTPEDISEVKKAFQEYHTKTCIKFLPWQPGDYHFITLQVNDSFCGYTSLCKTGGEQIIYFGGDCRKMNTIIHELGHSLCLAHEHTRVDREDYINFPGCNKKTIPRARSLTSHSSKGIYDYASQMHYECGECNLGGWPIDQNTIEYCGPDLTPGLSLLDADGINSLYDCQGCHRHRWRPSVTLTHSEKSDMESFGFNSRDGTPLYPCRVPFRGEVIPGKYIDSTKSCVVAHGNEVHSVKKDVEVLTFPKGLSYQCSNYKLEKVERVSVDTTTAVPAGTSFRRWNQRSFLAFASVTKSNSDKEIVIAKVAIDQEENRNGKRFGNATMVVGSVVHKVNDFKVLTCSLDKDCMIHQWYTNSFESSI